MGYNQEALVGRQQILKLFSRAHRYSDGVDSKDNKDEGVVSK